MNKSNKTEQQFFMLLRAGLWETDVRLESICDDDFAEIKRLAKEQSVEGLVAAGIEHVVDARLPEEESVKLVGKAWHLELQNAEMNDFIGKTVKEMGACGIKTLLVKGQGIAQCYERPLYRACGDVDFLLDEINFEKAKELLLPKAHHIGQESKYAKHLGMRIEEWEVELHGTVRCGLSKRIDRVLDALQYDSCTNGNVRVWKNGEAEVLLPAVDNDVLFVFTHFLNHFYKEGVGVRQICDWCRLLWTYRKEVDVDLLGTRLRKMGLMSEWKAFASFAVEFLGMPHEAMPYYDHSAKWKRKALRIKTFVMEVGNLGHKRDLSYYRKHPFVIRKSISVIHRLRDVLRHAQLFPLDSPRFFFNMMSVGLQNSTMDPANERRAE